MLRVNRTCAFLLSDEYGGRFGETGSLPTRTEVMKIMTLFTHLTFIRLLASIHYTSLVHSHSARLRSQNNDIHNAWKAKRYVFGASRSLVCNSESYGSMDRVTAGTGRLDGVWSWFRHCGFGWKADCGMTSVLQLGMQLFT